MIDATQHSSTSILVLGVGELGLAVLRALSQQRQSHTHITILLRPEAAHAAAGKGKDRLDALARLGISVLAGDLQQSTSDLAALFRPFNAVINCSGFVGGPGTQLRVTQAVLDAGIKRYFPWQFGVDYDVVGKGSGQQVWDEQLDVRHLLRKQTATDWVIVSTGIFTSYLFEPSFGVVEASTRTVYALGDWEYAVTLTTPEDIGRLTAALFFYQPVIRNQVIFIAGDTLTYAELADLMGKVWNSRVNRVLLDKEKLNADIRARPDDVAAKYRLAFARKDGVAWRKSDTFNAQRGIATVTAEQWLADNDRAVAG
ncbi:aromatic alcohol reductase [Erwinia sp. HDF1-3R]|uniref:aromatic alcohol reductase n=1 Tax=Erwinia sp. HDF1-3R TaxID=3141543 RepID=UPI0031F522E5